MLCARNRLFLSVISSQINKICNANASYTCAFDNCPKLVQSFPNLQTYRYKSKGKGKKKGQTVEETDSEDEEEQLETFDDLVPDKNAKVANVQVPSLRVDSLVKVGLFMARNKVDELFYDDKIRVNGQKVLKKASPVNEGDEIDVLKEVSVNNPNLLTVSRIQVLQAKPKGEGYSVLVRRWKSLLVDNYELQKTSKE